MKVSSIAACMRRFGLFLCAIILVSSPLFAGTSIDLARADVRRIAELVASDIQKNYYDPSLNGVDIKSLLAETKQKIDAMNDVGQMHAAVWDMAKKFGNQHTRYIAPRLTVKPTFGFKARGIGDDVFVMQLTKDSPAERAGLKVGDQVLALNGMRVSRDSIDDVLYFYRFLRPVRLLVADIARDGVRDRVTIEPAMRVETVFKRIDDISDIYRDIREEQNEAHENPFMYGKYDQVGYVKLTEFFGTLPETVMWKIKDAKAVVVDLRGNLGGSEETMKTFAGFFDQNETIILDRVNRKRTETVRSKPQRIRFDGPVVVLVDSQSASASEIIAYHLQRTKRAVVVGDKTAGAVAAAKPYFEKVGSGPVYDFAVLVTTDRAMFPDGKNIDNVGVTPDVQCLPTQKDLAAGKDPCLALGIKMLKEKLAPTSTAAAK